MISGKNVFTAVYVLCALLTLTCPAVPFDEDPAEEEKPAKILFVTGVAQTRTSEISNTDRRSARGRARDAAVFVIYGFNFEYVQEKDSAFVRTRSGGTLKSGPGLSFEQISLGAVNMLACTIEVHLDKKTVDQMAKEQEKTERVQVEIMLAPNQVRFAPLSTAITEALKNHYREITGEGENLKGHGWIEGGLKMEKVITPDKGSMLKVSMTLRLPDLKEK